MVIDHLGKPDYVTGGFSAWAAMVTAAAKHSNVYIKLSGLINEVPFWSVESFKVR